ncbi:hypothetical protein HMN09_00579900 [Mycena chlorophos]|uniref:DUF6533 domain-containing protein n=1 Tax=Mycena chlorophos TaxID=658473 RepID=A0A8H6W969_MYCCL|nr:hypothetical protein HMN09_00579900 [Mycena chlorophos]
MDPNLAQGSPKFTVAALMWVVYDLCLNLDREIWSVWNTPWGWTKGLYLFLRCNNLVGLSFYFMETLRTTPFAVLQSLPTLNNGKSSTHCEQTERLSVIKTAGRSYIAATEVLSVLVGEALILIRINVLYGWTRRWISITGFLYFSEAIVAIITTVITLTGGSSLLLGSQHILDCTDDSSNVPDLNIATWYVFLSSPNTQRGPTAEPGVHPS